MNQQTRPRSVIREDHGRTNRRLLAREATADWTRIESASRKVKVTLSSPEGKRLYLRCFNVTQSNFHFISVIARTRMPVEEIDKIEREMLAALDARVAQINQVLVDTEAKCHAHGITELASYDIEPLNIESKVFSFFGRRLLELIGKVDQLMPMFETLCIDEVLTSTQLNNDKSHVKKTVRDTARNTRTVRMNLERRINSVHEDERTRPARNESEEARPPRPNPSDNVLELAPLAAPKAAPAVDDAVKIDAPPEPVNAAAS